MQQCFGRRTARVRLGGPAVVADLEDVSSRQFPLVRHAGRDGNADRYLRYDGAEIAAGPENPTARVEAAADGNEFVGETGERRHGGIFSWALGFGRWAVGPEPQA